MGKTKHKGRTERFHPDMYEAPVTHYGKPTCFHCGQEMYKDYDFQLGRDVWVCTNPDCVSAVVVAK